MADPPIACTLTPADLQTRKEALLPGLARRAEVVEATEDGYRFRFTAASDTLQVITQVIEAERQCCRFLGFRMTVEPDGGPIWLDVTASAQAREFLAALLQPE